MSTRHSYLFFTLLFASLRTISAGQEDPKPQAEKQEPAKPPVDPARAGAEFLAIGAPPDPAKVAAGQKQFVKACAFCHGSDANGGNSGPNLVRSVLVLHDKGTGKEVGPVILNGRPGTAMPKFNYSDDQIKEIAAFLLSRSQAAANRMSYKIMNIVTGDPKAGEAYFGEHCASCHSATGNLAHVAAKYDPVALQSRFLYPYTRGNFPGDHVANQTVRTAKVTIPGGQTYEGDLLYVDDFTVTLKGADGERRTWSLDGEPKPSLQINDPLAEHARLLRQYSNADMHNILAYLETLK